MVFVYKKGDRMITIAKARETKGLSQIDLAGEVGITQQVLSSYERNISKPPLEVVVEIARVLGIKAEDLDIPKLRDEALKLRAIVEVALLKAKQRKEQEEKQETISITPEECRMVRMFRKLSKEQQDRILNDIVDSI